MKPNGIDKSKVRVKGVDKVPAHIAEVAYILHCNQAIRHFTAINIINHFIQNGEIDKSTKAKYVSFSSWDKFAVVINGLKKEYRYSEPFFINAIVGAFKSFADNAQKVLENYLRTEAELADNNNEETANEATNNTEESKDENDKAQ